MAFKMGNPYKMGTHKTAAYMKSSPNKLVGGRYKSVFDDEGGSEREQISREEYDMIDSMKKERLERANELQDKINNTQDRDEKLLLQNELDQVYGEMQDNIALETTGYEMFDDVSNEEEAKNKLSDMLGMDYDTWSETKDWKKVPPNLREDFKELRNSMEYEKGLYAEGETTKQQELDKIIREENEDLN